MKPPAPIKVKILSLGAPERYAVRRLVIAAQNELNQKIPDLALEICEINDPCLINKYVQVLVLPSLVINEQVYCSGRLPARQEVVGWLQQAYTATGDKPQ